VSGPAGSGKTTLVASWLEAKNLPSLWYRLDERDSDVATFFYYLGFAARKAAPRRRMRLPLLTVEYAKSIPVFTKRWFEQLCSRLPSPLVIVWTTSGTFAIRSSWCCEGGLRPAGGRLHRRRQRGAPSFARVSRVEKLTQIGWGPRFDLPRRARSSGGKTRPAERSVAQLPHDRRLGRRPRPDDPVDQRPPHLARSSATSDGPDYFATELFEKTDPDTQQFLLKSSFLPHLESSAVAELTGHKTAGAVLSRLSRSHFFTEQRSSAHAVYEYHPLFRAFLQARARETYSHEESTGLTRHAASCSTGRPRRAGCRAYRQSDRWARSSA
jgi:hypothetical protein